MKIKCKECTYYHKNNGTCQLKKCSTAGYGYVTVTDTLSCKYSKKVNRNRTFIWRIN